jgi:hypothetical protein
MAYTDLAAQARSNRSRAGAFTRRAAKDAEKAAGWYKMSASKMDEVAWLTARPGLWGQHWTPATVEDTARSYGRIADTFLRSSFHSTELAAFYRGLAARYLPSA